GQGFVLFSSYIANNNVGATTTVFGHLVDSSFKAQLYYAFGIVADAVDINNLSSVSSLPTGLTLLNGVVATYATGAATAGYFDYGNVQIPGYTSGPITFEVVAYNGADYASASIRGRSGAFTMAGIATGVNPSDSMNGMPNIVIGVPEPTTIVLATLGLASLALIRRRK
ncbi:MAG TPA: PEP-CTERM sorting domain-containing protein, partial [Dongiaceae bacterium]|nr:PEP-CTERM sorting domain-containing protein [Dongiaceae bacterium]